MAASWIQAPGSFLQLCFAIIFTLFFLQSLHFKYVNQSIFVIYPFQTFNQLIFKQFCSTYYTIHCSTKIQQPFFKYQAAVLSAEAWKSICFFIFVLYKMAQAECIYKCCKNTKKNLWRVKWRHTRTFLYVRILALIQ